MHHQEEDVLSTDENIKLRARVAELEYENALLLLQKEEGAKPQPPTPTIEPYVAAEIIELRTRLCQAENTVVTLKENSTTTSFTSEGPLGQRLLEKCRRLMKENDRLGEALVTSRISQLEQGGHFSQEREAVVANQLKALLSYNMAIESKLTEKDREITRLRGMLNELQQENAEHRSRERRRGGR